MARRRVIETGPSNKERGAALRKARVLTSYMLGYEVDKTRRGAVMTMESTELRAVLAEEEKDGIRPLGKSIRHNLDVVAGTG